MILSVKTSSRTELIDITSKIAKLVKESGVSEGLCMLYVPHTRHMEGNSAAHVKSTLVGASELVAIENGALTLGTWQGIFFCEFDGPRTRKIHVRITEQRFA
jgi:thiamine phosphate synthase YjbQ (UPF0047 family)